MNYSEDDILVELVALESMDLIRCDRQAILLPDPTVTIPEFRLGRKELLWWSLTPDGRDVFGRTVLPPP